MTRLTPERDLVREHTDDAVLHRLDAETDQRVASTIAQGRDAITRRLTELEREWDVERLLEVNASTLAGTGLVLAARRNRVWLLLPATVLGFLLQHGIQGWCPPLAVFRRLGVRTRSEIDAERMALLAARGDLARFVGADAGR
jgi:hypothetical protein